MTKPLLRQSFIQVQDPERDKQTWINHSNAKPSTFQSYLKMHILFPNYWLTEIVNMSSQYREV